MNSVTLISLDGDLVVIITKSSLFPDGVLVSVAYGDQYIPTFPVPTAALEALLGGKHEQAETKK